MVQPALLAKKLERNSVGYEINPDFLPIIKEKLNINKNQEGLEIITQRNKNIDFNDKICELPYIFKDPVKFDKKIDPKKLKFGSKIDNSDYKRETYYSIKEVTSPEIVVLDNGLKVRLLGIKEKKR